MVFLHEVERRASELRPTFDVDVVVDLRAEPGGLDRIHSVLVDAGFEQDLPGPDGAAHRYRLGAAVFDVLAPDNVGKRARLRLGAGRTIEAPGTTQAVRRSSVVAVEFGGVVAPIRRPNVVGALVGKAAAVVRLLSQSPASRTKHLRDLDSLAGLLGPEDRRHANLSRTERSLIAGLLDSSELTDLAVASLRALLDAGAS